MKAFSPLT